MSAPHASGRPRGRYARVLGRLVVERDGPLGRRLIWVLAELLLAVPWIFLGVIAMVLLLALAGCAGRDKVQAVVTVVNCDGALTIKRSIAGQAEGQAGASPTTATQGGAADAAVATGFEIDCKPAPAPADAAGAVRWPGGRPIPRGEVAPRPRTTPPRGGWPR